MIMQSRIGLHLSLFRTAIYQHRYEDDRNTAGVITDIIFVRDYVQTADDIR